MNTILLHMQEDNTVHKWPKASISMIKLHIFEKVVNNYYNY